MVIITIIAPYISILGILFYLLTGHRIKFQGKNGDDVKNETLDKVSETVKNIKRKLTEDDVNEASTTK